MDSLLSEPVLIRAFQRNRTNQGCVCVRVCVCVCVIYYKELTHLTMQINSKICKVRFVR